MSKLRLLFVLSTPAEGAAMWPVVEECRRREDQTEAIVCAADRDGWASGQIGGSGGIEADVTLDVGLARRTPAELTGRVIERIDSLLTQRRPDAVVLAGQTPLAVAAALAAAYRGVAVAHFEIASGDRPQASSPEALASRVVGLLGTLHLPIPGPATESSAEAVVDGLLDALSRPTAGDGAGDSGRGAGESGIGAGESAVGAPAGAPSRAGATVEEAHGGALPADLLLSVVIPVYNERDTLEEILRQVREVPIRKEIILVDDASTDGTRDLLARLAGQPDLRILYHDANQGKGAALRTGFACVKGDVVLIQDADLEYSPSQYPRLLRPIVEGDAEVVYGSRFAAGGPRRVLHYWHTMANHLLTTVSNMFTDLDLTDMETCYKVFRRDVIEAIRPTLRQNRFGIEPELTAKIARRKYRVFEIAIPYAGRTYSQGKKIGVKDAFQALWCTVRYWWAD